MRVQLRADHGDQSEYADDEDDRSVFDQFYHTSLFQMVIAQGAIVKDEIATSERYSSSQ